MIQTMSMLCCGKDIILASKVDDSWRDHSLEGIA